MNLRFLLFFICRYIRSYLFHLVFMHFLICIVFTTIFITPSQFASISFPCSFLPHLYSLPFLSLSPFQDGMVSAFIPYGTDSPELIRIATGVSMSLEGEEIVTMLDTVMVSGTEEEGTFL